MNDDQFFKMQNSRFFRCFNRISELVIVNLCGILLALCGLLVFGLYPAMFAAVAFFNDELEQRSRKPFKAMFTYFKKNFWIGNLLMLITASTVALGIYMIFGKELNMLSYLLIMTWMIFVLLLNLYLPSVSVLYPGFSLGKKMIFSFVAACNRWKTTIFLMLLSAVWVYAVALLPQFCMFVLLSTMPWFSILLIKKALKPETIVDPTTPIPEDYYFAKSEEKNYNEKNGGLLCKIGLRKQS